VLTVDRKYHIHTRITCHSSS